MAIQLTTTLQGDEINLTHAYRDISIVASGMPNNIIATGFNVKYLLTIIINNETVATLKAPLDSNNKAIFRIASVLQDFTQTDTKGFDSADANSTFNGNTMAVNDHSIHQIDKYSRNRSNLKYCFALAGYEYSTTQSGALIQQLSINTDVAFLYINSVIQHVDGYTGNDLGDYLLNSGQKKFLSIIPSVGVHPNGVDTFAINKIQLGQYHTLAFFNGKHYEDSKVTDIRIRTYDSDFTLIATQDVANTSANGGAAYGNAIQASYFQQSDNTDEGLLYFGCGTAQLEELGLDLTNVHTYTVVARNGISLVSKTYNFAIQQADCKGYETIRLAFLNRLGAYDYYNFTKKSVRRTQITKSPMKINYGNTPYAQNPYYTQGTYDGGTRTFNVNAVETIEVNTEFVTEQVAEILEELFLSPQVYIQTGSSFEPVVINETEYVKQTTANDMLKQYILTIEKGHNKRVQRL